MYRINMEEFSVLIFYRCFSRIFNYTLHCGSMNPPLGTKVGDSCQSFIRISGLEKPFSHFCEYYIYLNYTGVFKHLAQYRFTLKELFSFY